MSIPSVFSFEDANVRTIGTPDLPLFVAIDICNALQHSNPRKAIKDLVDPEDLIKSEIETNGGRQTVNCVNESGLYALIFGSKLESAKRFKRWVTSEVLPAIRKTGRYEAQETITPAEQHAVQRAVASRAQKTASNYQTIYRAIKARYQIARYDQLPRTQLADCLDFIKEVELAVPEVTHTTHHEEGRCPCCGLRPIPQGSLVLPGRDAEAIMNFVYMWRYLFRAEIELFYQMLRSVQSPHAARFFETFNDLNLPMLEETLKRYGYDMTKLPCYLALNARK